MPMGPEPGCSLSLAEVHGSAQAVRSSRLHTLAVAPILGHCEQLGLLPLARLKF